MTPEAAALAEKMLSASTVSLADPDLESIVAGALALRAEIAAARGGAGDGAAASPPT